MPDKKKQKGLTADSVPESERKATIGYVVCCITGLLSAVLLAAAVTDGNALLQMKDEDKVIGTEGLFEMKKLPFIGYPYGIGIYKDTFTNSWGEGKRFNEYIKKGISAEHKSHFTQLYGCDDHQMRGKVVISSCIIVLLTVIGYVCTSVIGISKGGGQKYARICLGFLATSTGFLFIALGASGSLYNDSFTCSEFPLSKGNGQSYSLAMKDIFQLGYGMPFMIITIIFGLLNIITVVFSGSLNDPKPAEDTEPMTEE